MKRYEICIDGCNMKISMLAFCMAGEADPRCCQAGILAWLHMSWVVSRRRKLRGLTGAGWKQIWKTNDMNWFFRKKIMKYDLYKYMLYIIVPFWTVNVDGNILQFFFKSFLQKALSYDQFSPRYRSSTKSSLKVILLHIPIYSQLEDHWNLDIEENCFWRPKTFVCRVAFYVLYYSECWGQTWHNFVECPRTFGRKNTC